MSVGQFIKFSRSTVNVIVIGLNILVAMALLLSAYGGLFDPGKFVVAALMTMALPAMMVLGFVTAVLDIVVCRKALWIILAAFAVALPPLSNFFPLHFRHSELTEAEKQRSFTFLTYNVMHLWDFRGNVPGEDENATVDYILNTDADIVSLQEAEIIRQWPLWRITAEQIKALEAKYPYRQIGINDQFSVLSKYPFTMIPLDYPPRDVKHFCAMRLYVGGDTINLFNLHLESIGLTPDDKALYRNLLKDTPDSEQELKREVKAVKTQLIAKLAKAFNERAAQARYVRNVIDSIGGNWIVAGDFNDVPTCYAIRTIREGDDLHDAYAECATGPTITFHASRFYFRIDHVLYKGNFKAVDIERGNPLSSDHYPLLTTFVKDK